MHEFTLLTNTNVINSNICICITINILYAKKNAEKDTLEAR